MLPTFVDEATDGEAWMHAINTTETEPNYKVLQNTIPLASGRLVKSYRQF